MLLFRRFINSDWMFILVFAALAIIYYDGVLDKGPMSLHVWRQSDCLSLTNQYMNGNPLWEPEMHIQLGDDFSSGKTAGEFPILYYIVGNLWKVTGQSFFVYRIFYLTILFFGTFALYKGLKELLKDNFWAIGIASLIMASPVYIVYGVSFITDVPAVCFVFISLFFILKYHRLNSKRNLYLALSFIALAGLIKVSSLIVFVFLGLVLLLETLGIRTLGSSKFFHGRNHEWMGFSSVILVIIGWYLYAHIYNDESGFKYTFNNIYPLWIMSNDERVFLWKNVIEFASYMFFNRSVYVLLALAFVVNLILVTRVSLFATLSNLIIMIGCIIYFLLWAPLMGNHDYYYAQLLILPIAIIAPLVHFSLAGKRKIGKNVLIKTIAVVLLIWNFGYASSMVQLRTRSEKGQHWVVANKELVGLLQWINWETNNEAKDLHEMQDYLTKIGVKKEDKVFCYPDETFNFSLFLLDRKGWTNFQHYEKSSDLDFLISKGAKYMIVYHKTTSLPSALVPYTENKVGEFKGIEVYSLKK